MHEQLEKFAERALKVCHKEGWRRDWEGGGCYLHLEASEFIEALRGKGNRYEEAADMLFAFFAILKEHDMSMEDVFDHFDTLLTRLETESGRDTKSD